MSRRVSLKEFQEGLSKRLKAAAGETAPTARLGFEAGGEHWLARLDHSGEVFDAMEFEIELDQTFGRLSNDETTRQLHVLLGEGVVNILR